MTFASAKPLRYPAEIVKSTYMRSISHIGTFNL